MTEESDDSEGSNKIVEHKLSWHSDRKLFLVRPYHVTFDQSDRSKSVHYSLMHTFMHLVD